MAADEHRALRFAAERVPVVPGGVPLDLEREVRQPVGEPGAPPRPGLGPRDPLGAVVVAGQRAKLTQAIDDAGGIERHGSSLTPSQFGSQSRRAVRIGEELREHAAGVAS